jgi:hypothetical protein
MRQTVDGVDNYTVVFGSASDKEEWWMGLDDVINDAKREMCFPEHDHQLLTNRGFLFLDDVLRAVDWHHTPGGKIAVNDWRNLEVATYDVATARLLYRQPHRLVVNAPGADVIEFGSRDVRDSSSGAQFSVVATRRHELFVRTHSAEYEKQSCEALIERMHAGGDAATAHFLAVARNGVANRDAVAGQKRADDATLPTLALESAQAKRAFLELYGYWLGAANATLVANGDLVFGDASERDRAQLVALCGALGVPATSRDAAFTVHCSALGGVFRRERRVAAWALDRLACDDVRSVVRGLALGAGNASCVVTACADLRDDLVRLLLHAGYSPTFERAGDAWCVRYVDADCSSSMPSVRLGDVVREYKYAHRTWCVDLGRTDARGERHNDGFVVVRRAERCGNEPTAAVTWASRATIQGNCFGLKLHELMTGNAKEIGRDIPRFVTQCIAFIDEHGLDQEGLYRISGSSTDIENARAKYNKGQMVDFRAAEIHLVSGLLKLWLRDLREPLCTFGLFNEFISLIDEDAKPHADVLTRLAEIVLLLPQYERFSLHELMLHLSRVAKAADKNNMRADNLAIVIGPNILKSPDANPAAVHKTFPRVFKVIELMIDNVDTVFAAVPAQRKALLDAAKEESQREKEQFLNVKKLSEANIERVVSQLASALEASSVDRSVSSDGERVLREVLRRGNASTAECMSMLKAFEALTAAAASAGGGNSGSAVSSNSSGGIPRGSSGRSDDGAPMVSPRSFLAAQRAGRATMGADELTSYAQTARRPPNRVMSGDLSPGGATRQASTGNTPAAPLPATITSSVSMQVSPAIAATRPKRSLSIGGGCDEAVEAANAASRVAADWNVRASPLSGRSKPPSRPPPPDPTPSGKKVGVPTSEPPPPPLPLSSDDEKSDPPVPAEPDEPPAVTRTVSTPTQPKSSPPVPAPLASSKSAVVPKRPLSGSEQTPTTMREFVMQNSQLASQRSEGDDGDGGAGALDSDDMDDSSDLPPPEPAARVAPALQLPSTSTPAAKKANAVPESGSGSTGSTVRDKKNGTSSKGDSIRVCQECGKNRAKHRVTLKSGEKKVICVDCMVKYPPRKAGKDGDAAAAASTTTSTS